jgi:hypothetical protein
MRLKDNAKAHIMRDIAMIGPEAITALAARYTELNEFDVIRCFLPPSYSYLQSKGLATDAIRVCCEATNLTLNQLNEKMPGTNKFAY